MASAYPDGTRRANSNVVIPVHRSEAAQRIAPKSIDAIVAHRNLAGVEEYLVQWHCAAGFKTPYSWHNLDELAQSLNYVQKYVENRRSSVRSSNAVQNGSKGGLGKRKRLAEHDSVGNSSPAPSDSTSSVASGPKAIVEQLAYGAILSADNGIITCSPRFSDKQELADAEPPWDLIRARAAKTHCREAHRQIRIAFLRRLDAANRYRPHVPLTITNEVDAFSPSLEFAFTETSRLGEDVYAMDPDTIVGCGDKKPWSSQVCSPHMGQGIGCEYARVCDCMEDAAIEESRMSEADRERQQNDPDNRINLPKRFPYGTHSGLLVGFYLRSRHPIYECNVRCKCGDVCKSRVVQRGRRVPLEIFRTSNGRGWGLRCGVDLEKGQFVDTYRGEIITSEEADRREEEAAGLGGQQKDSYLFSLDKHVGADLGGQELTQEECYVVDGEHVGGPTRFINHSCDPNCQMHTASMNRFDVRIYELAFFTNQFVPKETELTFDYVDKDGDIGEEIKKPEGPVTACLCGSRNCRKWLWL